MADPVLRSPILRSGSSCTRYGDRGQIYRGCTAFDAARYTLDRLAALGGELRSVLER